MLTIESVYDYLQSNKKDLNFIPRIDVVSEAGTSKFSTLFCNEYRDDIPEELRLFLESIFGIKKGYYDFLQVQKYEIGDYILPHRDVYPHFNLVTLSTSSIDSLVMEGEDGVYQNIPDQAGRMVNIPKYKWHWVNPVREKTRYTAVVGVEMATGSFDDVADLLA